ncbi:MAG: YlxR family protein [Ruminococcaceae bacterium]|nr:YlxR family protein [Oscillospiraceae bacterium]
MCIGCMTKNDKYKLIRIVKNSDNTIKVDNKNNSDGRGAYICEKEECVIKAKKKNALRRALKCDVDDKIYDVLLEEIKNG